MASKVKRLDPDFGMSGAPASRSLQLAELEDCDTFSKAVVSLYGAEDKH